MVLLAASVVIALAASIGWVSHGKPAGPADASNRKGSFMGGIEQITDSLVHLLEGGPFGEGEKNTARAGVLQRSPR